jgi:hypothetical protein
MRILESWNPANIGVATEGERYRNPPFAQRRIATG